MFRAENALMLDAAIQKMEGAIDARMTGYENRISKEVSDLQKRTEQLELREKARAEGNNPAVQEVKRRRRSLSVETGSDGVGSNARSYASSRRHRLSHHLKSTCPPETTPQQERAGALMLPSSCLDGSVTPVGPGQNPQYTGAVQRREAVGCPQGLKMSPQNSMVAERQLQFHSQSASSAQYETMVSPAECHQKHRSSASRSSARTR